MGVRRSVAAALAAGLALAACGGGGGVPEGVELSVVVTPEPPRVGPATVEIELAGADGAPLSGAELQVEGNMSHAGMVPSFGDALEVSPGVYAADLDLTMAGDWFLVITGDLADGRALEALHDLPGVRRREG